MTLTRRLVIATAPALLALPAYAQMSAPRDLQIIDRRIGFGDIAAAGRVLVVHYTGWLFDAAGPGGKGSQFASSHESGQTLSFQLGVGKVIPGWDQGLPGMKVGGLRELVIPPELAYGARGAGPIPPNAALVFDVELMAVR
jgi:FKBP-type peptidyl-prolyl cis-trans isomerase FkpA